MYDSTYMMYQAIKSIETESRMGAARSWGGGELQFNRYRDCHGIFQARVLEWGAIALCVLHIAIKLFLGGGNVNVTT